MLDTPALHSVNRGFDSVHLPVFRPLILHDGPGRIAQRESVPFTRERSKVRSLVRPPRFAKRLRVAQPRSIITKRVRRSSKSVDGLGRVASAPSKTSKTTPCTVADLSRINGLRFFRIFGCSVGQNRGMMA